MTLINVNVKIPLTKKGTYCIPLGGIDAYMKKAHSIHITLLQFDHNPDTYENTLPTYSTSINAFESLYEQSTSFI